MSKLPVEESNSHDFNLMLSNWNQFPVLRCVRESECHSMLLRPEWGLCCISKTFRFPFYAWWNFRFMLHISSFNNHHRSRNQTKFTSEFEFRYFENQKTHLAVPNPKSGWTTTAKSRTVRTPTAVSAPRRTTTPPPGPALLSFSSLRVPPLNLPLLHQGDHSKISEAHNTLFTDIEKAHATKWFFKDTNQSLL